MSIRSTAYTLVAAALLSAAAFAPTPALAGGYGYDSGGYDYQPSYQPRYYQQPSYQHCYYRRVRYYDDYYNRYSYRRERVCD
ncbi:hypothetical protein [Labrys wisconsinensis]|uniref:Lectin-like protein BA14k n=1 Tax=Labrys wisconsinensis TaxID=425677 RepID=A0ABU0JLH2_9HYPH|nr:hypothetical protein [Labrys wisconsinensis]MDQ0475144.1 hypothetical protein [Labrys wisconsinensis]